ncbi:MAG: hypothetical protein HOI56_05180 [Gammaproteobacteria bacterium]|jgi:hypothetical protein|nr:hypothetical protein [Gammaproteobacteria bacterium]MBT4462374.1 hypothetical protein [Gammaproteobacteria bacterium]MBT4655301.1 hypothetical protein [Gammaproteobacteria bacterium]MBT5117227.1 hypothetical protein [Gammaproteobacteria bacterium]MBT5762116.1 hypothetical protein [Gammaproteobacteria bacterium]
MKLMSTDKFSDKPQASKAVSIRYTNNERTLGVQTFENGDVYTGAFLNGKKHGKGLLETLSNRTYDGGWENDLPHGLGVNTFPNGKMYSGEYRKGRPYGNGQWTYSDGKTYSGTWIKGEFINENNKKDTLDFRIVTFLINILVISFMLSVVGFWVLNFLNII